MTAKAKLSIVALFSCCSMIGMGFASWTISQGPAAGSSAEVSGTVSAENVVTSDEFISAPFTPQGLVYTDEGFTGASGSSYQGALSVSFQIDVAQCKLALGDRSRFAVTIKLNKEDVEDDLFGDSVVFVSAEKVSATWDGLPADQMSGAESKVTATNTSYSKNTSEKSFTVSGTLDYAAASAVVVLTVNYTFNFTDAANFKKYFYDPFTADSDLAFLFGASLTGGGNRS